MPFPTKEPDFIIVGAGAAGAVLASRIAQSSDRTVLLVEAGGKARGPLFSVPLMTGVLLRGTVANWGYVTEPQRELAQRRIAWPRGKGLGGSTLINGMVYMRGLPADFDGWAQNGLPGWSWNDVLPRFRRLERAPHLDADWHGHDGPLTITRSRQDNPLFAVFLEAARAAGHPVTDDFNGPVQEGCGAYDFTISGGRRVSAASAFLRPALTRKNLMVMTRRQVLRIVIEDGRARGIAIAENGRERIIHAAAEIILCGGAINSPQVLMLSGIGPADDLRRLGISVVADLPGVGKNLQDHLLVRVSHQCTEPVTLDRYRRIDRAILAFFRAWIAGTGPAASFPLEVGGLFKSDPVLDLPDLQCHFMPSLSSASLRIPFMGAVIPKVSGNGFFANVMPMRSRSRGWLTLASADPLAKPRIDPCYLSDPEDRERLREGVKRLREIFASSPFDRFRGDELAPGPDIRTDAEIENWLSHAADTCYHPTGTCRMGREGDENAVLDARLRVRGIAGLRVADASVMPSITSCNTAAPTMMIAETCAEFIMAGH